MSVTVVRVGTWPFFLRVVGLHRKPLRIWALCKTLYGEFKYHWFRTLNTSKYPRLLSKMIKTNSPLVCPLCFFVIFAVLGFLCHRCSPLHNRNNRNKRQETMLHQNTMTHKQWFNNVLHLHPVHEEGAIKSCSWELRLMVNDEFLTG